MKKTILKAFVAGFLATLVFHQGLIGLAYLGGLFPKAPFNMAPVPPLGVPSVISLAFFGGLWGILIWMLVRKDYRSKFWLKSFVFGGLGPTAVALFVVFPLKGMPVAQKMYLLGFILNGVWGIGNSIFMRLFGEHK